MKNIIRIEKRKKFTIISRQLLEDKNLKWSTRGLLAYLLCKPDNWVLQVTDLKKNGDLGRDAIYSRIKEAIKFGYITRIDHRDKSGRLCGVEYIVHEDPLIPLPENQDEAKPDTDKPDTSNPSTTKDSSLANTKSTTTTTKLESVSSGDYFFHKQISQIQRNEILDILSDFNLWVIQDVLDELAGFIDKNLIQRDVVSLSDGLAKKAKKGEFNIRLGVKYKNARLNKQKVIRQNKESIKTAVSLPGADINDPLVQRMMNISKGR